MNISAVALWDIIPYQVLLFPPSQACLLVLFFHGLNRLDKQSPSLNIQWLRPGYFSILNELLCEEKSNLSLSHISYWLFAGEEAQV